MTWPQISGQYSITTLYQFQWDCNFVHVVVYHNNIMIVATQLLNNDSQGGRLRIVLNILFNVKVCIGSLCSAGSRLSLVHRTMATGMWTTNTACQQQLFYDSLNQTKSRSSIAQLLLNQCTPSLNSMFITILCKIIPLGLPPCGISTLWVVIIHAIQ